MLTHDTVEIEQQLIALGDPDVASHSRRFFKTGKGQYGEGDQFLGIRMPVLRQHVNQHWQIELEQKLSLLHSSWHEVRLFALLLLVHSFQRVDEKQRKAIYKLYLANTKYINNWDLVDGSSHQIVGGYLFDKDRQPLYALARSRSLWRRRIAMMSTYHFIKQDDYADALNLAELLLQDKEDLIHKVCGWMLREVGKRSLETEKQFLQQHYQQMPRTMLRYAIERFTESDRKRYLSGTV